MSDRRRSTGRRSRLSDDPRWFQHSVFYEVLIRGFFDSNADGTGDIAGLTAKLDYLAWLGVDCLWQKVKKKNKKKI
jgi:maltose alpha-D-glucosyltransferase/alpha-amylase